MRALRNLLILGLFVAACVGAWLYGASTKGDTSEIHFEPVPTTTTEVTVARTAIPDTTPATYAPAPTEPPPTEPPTEAPVDTTVKKK